MRNQQNLRLSICLIAVIFLCYLGVLAPAGVSAWNEGNEEEPGNPSKGTQGGIHPWIIGQALDHLRKERMIEKGSWFDSVEFENLLKWGAWYADNTGTDVTISVPLFGEVAGWRADAQTHFYDQGDVYIEDGFAVSAAPFILWSDYVNTGDLNAPEYATQLYSRAVEFWPGGQRPLDLDQLRNRNKVYSLGFTGIPGGRQYWYSWGQGTDPDEGIREDRPGDPPRWPSWAENGQESRTTAAIYLGWSAHLVQDMSVYHHVHRLHGSSGLRSHSGYENSALELVKANDAALVELPFEEELPNSASDYFRVLPVSFGITDLANEVAKYGGTPLPSIPSSPSEPSKPQQPDDFCYDQLFLFSIDIGFIDVLDTGQRSDALLREFEKYDRQLVTRKVTVIQPGSRWLIKDTASAYDSVYIIRLEWVGAKGRMLNVYDQFGTCKQRWTTYVQQLAEHQQELIKYRQSLEEYHQEMEAYPQKMKQHQVAALDNAIKGTAALIYKYIYEVSEHIYVDSSHSGIEDGSVGHPFNTLHEAVLELSRRPTKTIIRVADRTHSQPTIIDEPCTLELWLRD